MKLKLINTDKKKRKNKGRALNPQSRRGRSILVFLSFVVLSAVFWLMQSLQQIHTTSFSIPVVYAELPPDIGASGQLPDRLKIELKDQGIVLLSYKLNRFHPIYISASEKQIKRRRAMTLNRQELSELLQKQLQVSTTIVSISPDEIATSFYVRKQKTVPIKINGEFTPKNGFYAFDPEINPKEATIYGSKEDLAKISAVETEEFDIDNMEADFSGELKINSIKDIVIKPSKTKLNIHVEQLTEQTFELPIITKDVPEKFLLRPLPGKVSVQLTIPTSHYNEVTETDLQVAVFYPKFSDSLNKDSSLPVELVMKPDWLRHYKITPSDVQFIIERIQ